ncbi:gluconokinase [Microbacterium sp. EST19A]|uniref:gluconokinase n=1 Tax=Microbacterium sp. EST19A TaxID=2862681 RepID=UPI001CBE809C|nr:gluconokinase [Microbacterium sp. EST19A]
MTGDTGAAASCIVVMGVSGVGKTTLGRELSRRLHLPFIDGDNLHSAHNVDKMRAGIPLSDRDRVPWLDDVGAVLASSNGVIVACSALKREYRDRIRHLAPRTFFLELDATPAFIASRLANRADHFMPESLLASQLESLEPLQNENGMRIDVEGDTEKVLELTVAACTAAFGGERSLA